MIRVTVRLSLRWEDGARLGLGPGRRLRCRHVLRLGFMTAHRAWEWGMHNWHIGMFFGSGSCLGFVFGLR